MPQVKLYNVQGEPVGSVDVPQALDGPVSRPILWQAVRMYLANRRQGTADTKRRGEVRGGEKKPWR